MTFRNLGDMHTLKDNLRMAQPGKWPQIDPTVVSTFGERVGAARRARGLSQNKLSKLAGCSQPFINQLESGDMVDMRAALLFRISDILDVSARWLLWGTGPVHKWEILTDDERAFIKKLRVLPDPMKDHVSRVLDSLGQATSAPPSPAHPRFPPVPAKK